MGAYDELSLKGECGDETIALLRRLARQVARGSSFPPPDGYSDWTTEAVDDLLADMFSTKGQAFVLACLSKATDEGSLERLLLASVKNHLIDLAKGTERGKLRRRLETLLGNDGRFVRVDGPGWRLASYSEGTVWQGDGAFLEAAAAAVRGVQLGKLPPSGPTPRGSVEALVTVAHAVLQAAGGAVRDEDLARVLEARFSLLQPPMVVSLTADEGFVEVASLDDGPERVVVEADERAELLWESLAPLERSLVPHLRGTVEDVMAVAEVGPVTAAALTDALREKLRRATEDDEQQEATLRALLHKCRSRP